LKNEPGVEVELRDGNRGELTVAVDGKVVAQKNGDSMPTVEQVQSALGREAPAHSGQ